MSAGAGASDGEMVLREVRYDELQNDLSGTAESALGIIEPSVPNDDHPFSMFRKRPLGAGRDALVSSMQSFETSVFLIGLRRYPHALSTAVFALESALKAAPLDQRSLQDLLREARQVNGRMSSVSQPDVDLLRTTRNRIVHHGFSPEDDALSCELFLGAAVPLLDGAYRDFFDFDLYDGLLIEFGDFLRDAIVAFKGRDRATPADATRFLLLLASLVRFRVQQALTSAAADATAAGADEIGITFDHVEARRKDIERQLELPWIFDCPICDNVQTLVCDLEDDALKQGRVVISRGFCASCDLAVHKKSAVLLNLACASALELQRPEILADFGITRDDA